MFDRISLIDLTIHQDEEIEKHKKPAINGITFQLVKKPTGLTQKQIETLTKKKYDSIFEKL